MEYNQQPPVTSAPPTYMQQEGEQATQPPPVTAQPPYIQQQQGQVNVITTPISLEELIGYIARGAALLTTFLATVIFGTSNQTKGEIIETTMKFSYFSAFKYFLAANIIVLIYSIASLLISIIMKPKPLIITLSIAFVDIVAATILLTANGAASAISRQLDDVDHLFESSVCSYYVRFCSQIKASIAMSMLASGIYLGLIVLTLLIFANKKN